jgi:hypothetical protein
MDSENILPSSFEDVVKGWLMGFQTIGNPYPGKRVVTDDVLDVLNVGRFVVGLIDPSQRTEGQSHR